MAQIFPVDDRHRIWQVKDLITQQEFDDLKSVNWLDIPWQRGRGQTEWKRRLLDNNDHNVQRINQYIKAKLSEINSALSTTFEHFNGHFWLDEPGFDVAIHTDGQLPNAMQIYWIVPDEQYGTGFYFYRSPDTLQYQFMSYPNTGYIMLNHVNSDGSQPLLWHGMLNTVPEGTFRLSSYWYFN